MKLKEDIEELMKKYEKMDEEQKAEFRRLYGLVERFKARKRRDISAEDFLDVLKQVIDITSQKADLISKWKELQRKLDPNPKNKKVQLKRILYAAFDGNLSALEKMKYRKTRGRGYRIFDYAQDHAGELDLKPFTEEEMEFLNEAYLATLSFPKRYRLSRRDKTGRKNREERTTNDSPTD